MLVTFPGLASQAGVLAWIEDGKAGIALEHPLYEAVLDGLVAKMAA